MDTSREPRASTALYDRHKNPRDLDRQSLPSFRKTSCRSISDGVSITAATNNPEPGIQRVLPRRSMFDIRPVSYSSSLPSSSSSVVKAGERKRAIVRPPLRSAKRGKPSRLPLSRNSASSISDDFDSLLFDCHQGRQATPTSTPPTSVSGDVAEVYEVLDSPPHSSPSHNPHTTHTSHTPSCEVVREVSPAPSSTSSSSTSDLIAVQHTCRLQENSPSSQTPSLPPLSSSSHVPIQPLSTTHTLLPDDRITQMHHRNQKLDGAQIDVDSEEDCQITEPKTTTTTTTSRYFRNRRGTAGLSEREKGSPLRSKEEEGSSNCHVYSPAAPEDELLQFRKTTSNFSRKTRDLANRSSDHSSPLSLSRGLSPRNAFVRAIENFNDKNIGQSSDLGSDNFRGNVAVSSSGTPTLSNPELDEEEGVFEREGEGVCHSGASRNTRWAGGERKERTSVFDFLDDTKTSSNTNSFYGGGSGVVQSYGLKQVMAARNKNKKMKLSLHSTLEGKKAPQLKTTCSVRELDFASSGKTLMSLEHKKRQGAAAVQSSDRATHLSTVEEVELDVDWTRIGTLESIPVTQCLLSSGEISLKLVAKDTPLKYTITFSEINEFKMNLVESPRCVMVRLHPLPARKIAYKLRSQFKLSNQRFLNVESRHCWEWYWVLQIEQEVAPNTVARVHEWVNDLESQKSDLKVKVQRHMSGDDVSEFLAQLDQQSPVSLFSSQPTDTYRPASCRDVPQGDTVRRSSRIQNRESGVERVRWMMSDNGDEEEEVTYVPKGDPKKIILTYKPEGTRVNIEISEMDLDCLEPGVYLNDRVIDFYLMYLWYDSLGMELRDRVHIFSSFFHQRLMDSSRDLTGNKDMSVAKRLHDRVKSWTRHVDLFSKDYIILPVCVRSHWFLALICHPGHFKPSPTSPAKKRKKPHPRPKVLRNTRSRMKQEEAETERVIAESAIELINLNYSQEDDEDECEREKEGEGERETQLDSLSNGCEVKEEGVDGSDIHYSSCEEDDRLGEGGTETVRGRLRKAEAETVGERVREGETVGEGVREAETVGERVRESETVGERVRETETGEERVREGVDGEKESSCDLPATDSEASVETIKDEEETKKPCIMILDSLEIRRGPIVTRINNYLTEEWEAKKKESTPLKFKLKTVYPKLLPQNNSCDCGVFVLQYVESLFHCMKKGEHPPSMPDDWASYHQTQAKRQQLKTLITRLGAGQSHTQTTPTNSQSHASSTPVSPDLIDVNSPAV